MDLINGRWPQVPLKEVLSQRKEFIQIDDLQTYKRCRVQLHAKGVVLRDIVQGAEIKTKEQQVCRAGEFLVAEIDAKVGGYGIVPPDLDGAIVSSHYFLFQIDETLLDRQFLHYFIQTSAFAEQVSARGSTNYAAIRPKHVLEYVIPLPPLAEQRRIVARIEALAAKVEAARELRERTAEETRALIDAEITKILGNAPAYWQTGPIPKFAEVNPSRRGQVNLSNADLVTFIPMEAVDEVHGTIARPQIKRYDEVAKGYTWFVEGDVIFARITPCMQNGKAALAQGLINGVGFGSTEFHVLRPGPDILGTWLHILVRHSLFKKDAADHFKGTAGQQRVPQSFLEQKVITVPTLPEQHRIVARLDALQAQVAAVQAYQAATSAALEALMPSILDRAFRGEL